MASAAPVASCTQPVAPMPRRGAHQCKGPSPPARQAVPSTAGTPPTVALQLEFADVRGVCPAPIASACPAPDGWRGRPWRSLPARDAATAPGPAGRRSANGVTGGCEAPLCTGLYPRLRPGPARVAGGRQVSLPARRLIADRRAPCVGARRGVRRGRFGSTAPSALCAALHRAPRRWAVVIGTGLSTALFSHLCRECGRRAAIEEAPGPGAHCPSPHGRVRHQRAGTPAGCRSARCSAPVGPHGVGHPDAASRRSISGCHGRSRAQFSHPRSRREVSSCPARAPSSAPLAMRPDASGPRKVRGILALAELGTPPVGRLGEGLRASFGLLAS